jgi:serine/threonine protein kinase
MSTDEAIIHSGWCEKLCSGKVFKPWKRRWFVLRSGLLSYYPVPNGALKKAFDIREAVAYLNLDSKRLHSFAVKTSKLTLVLAVDSDAEAEEWVAKISRNIQLQHMKIRLADFEILKILGVGAYGKVRLVKLKGAAQLFAMKSLSKAKLAQNKLVGRTMAERNVLLNANHPNLVSARYSFQTDTKVFLIMDYVCGGELLQRIRDLRRVPEDSTRLYAAELVLAIEYLHAINVTHRDLKPENVLFDERGHLRITDFGLVKENMGEGSTTATFCGTPEYIAPEIIRNTGYTSAVDWWSLGILIFEMLFGFRPFHGQSPAKTYRMIINDDLEFPRAASPAAKSIISGLCQKDPDLRLGCGERGVTEIKEHPFFQGLDWIKVLNQQIPMPWVPPPEAKLDGSAFKGACTEESPAVSLEDPHQIPDQINQALVGFTCTNQAAIDAEIGQRRVSLSHPK